MDTVRVVVADDNIQLQSMVAEYLNAQSGIEVVGAAANGMEAIRLIQEKTPDVLICDMIMPQMDGYGVLEQLGSMKLARKPGVIALTALGRDDFITRAVNLGACYYMVKPFDFSV
ncbi:MAG: response regulator, partial [Clostridia bacterium]|nr:response regulator [Clostridia bacterium]